MPTPHETAVGKILDAKFKNGWSWAQIAEKIGQAPVWTAAALSGQCALSEADCETLGEMCGLDADDKKALLDYPYRGALPTLVPTDPFVYRFYEIMQVYGIAMKNVAQEEFGDGIMSAIDFSIDIDREEDPKGDRVKITFSGKFLPYKRF
ncbi:MAG: cyanase [Planctomycetota bacterium]